MAEADVQTAALLPDVGVVVIGRNEGERLVRCLASVPLGLPVVYVDSGSTDGSVAHARDRRVSVVELDLTTPFTAARARNAGAERLFDTFPTVRFVQFVDGDSELRPNWLATGRAALAMRPDLAAVFGRLQERRPELSVYNRLCQLEWGGQPGPARECGGIVMVSARRFQLAGGFHTGLIAGEEPELCVRLRLGGGCIERLPIDMALHDAAMTRFGQWWKRAVRAGHAYAEVSALHGRGPDRTWVREVRSNWFWGAAVPLGGLVAVVGIAAVSPAASLVPLGLVAAGYGVFAGRIFWHARRRGWSAADARLFAAFTALAKLPMALGQAKYHLNRLTGRSAKLIEYKAPEAARC